MQDTPQTISRSARHFFSGTMLSRVTGMLRDMALAFAFGTQGAVAAFMVAFRFAQLLRRLLGEGALQTAFIPHFEALRREGGEPRAQRFFGNLVASLSLLLFLITCLTEGILALTLLYGDLSPGNLEIVQLTMLMFPGVIFICLFGLNASLLQCERDYIIPSIAPVAFNIIWILGILCVGTWPVTPAMQGLSVAVVLACFGQWAVTLPKTKQFLSNSFFRTAWQNFSLHSADLRRLAKPLLLGTVGVAATQINSALDAVFARYASDEGPALLWYAIRLQQLPLALFGIALSGAVLPPLSRAAKAGDWHTYKSFLEHSMQQCAVLMIPATLVMFVAADVSINLLYGHGDFSQDSTVGTVWCLWGYAVGLVPMTFVLLLAPGFYAQNDYRTPAIGVGLAVGLSVVLNYLMIAVMDWGPSGVAFATAISAWFNHAYLSWHLTRRIGTYLSSGFYSTALRVTLVAFLAAVATLAALYLFHLSSLPLSLLSGLSFHYPRDLFSQFTSAIIAFGTYGAVFFGLGWLFRIHELFEILSYVGLRRRQMST